MSPGRITTLLALLLCACAVLLSGCGGDNAGERPLSKREYIERFNDLQQDAATIFDDLDAATRNTKVAQSHLEKFDTFITGVEALRPPRDWSDEHSTLLESLRAMRQSIDVLSRAPASKPGAIAAQVERFTNAQRTFQDAVREMNITR